MVHEDTAKAAIAKDGAAQLSDIGRRFQPAGRFDIKVPKLLQLVVFFFRQ